MLSLSVHILTDITYESYDIANDHHPTVVDGFGSWPPSQDCPAALQTAPMSSAQTLANRTPPFFTTFLGKMMMIKHDKTITHIKPRQYIYI